MLISHFDTVWTEEYGVLEPLAFHPEELTKKLMEPAFKKDLPENARIDLETGKYLFGRGTMDMKMGIALHMQLIEKASVENWPINLLLTTVPDEEVNSAGMRAAVTELVRLREEHGLAYKLFLNSEPSFSQNPTDIKEYIYSGINRENHACRIVLWKGNTCRRADERHDSELYRFLFDTAYGVE